MLITTTPSEPIGRCTRMRRSFVRFNRLESFVHTRSSAGFTISTSGFEFSVHTGLALAEQLCRTADRIDPARVFGPHHCLGRATSASDSEKLCGLLQRRENASVIEQGCACLSP